MKRVPKKVTAKMKERYKQIDDAIQDIQNGRQHQKDAAGETLLRLFEPLIKSASTKIIEKHKHFDYQDIKIRAQYILITMSMNFRKPRTDTRAAGRTRGEWASNFNIYARQNLYYFTIVDLMKEDDTTVNKAVSSKTKTKFVKENIDNSKNSELLSAISILNKIEDVCGERPRDIIMLKSLFCFNNGEISWIAGISKNSVKTTIDRVMVRMKKFKNIML